VPQTSRRHWWAEQDEVISLLQKMMTEPDFGNLFQYCYMKESIWQKEAAVKLIAKRFRYCVIQYPSFSISTLNGIGFLNYCFEKVG
jgi:hypothetical protein